MIVKQAGIKSLVWRNVGLNPGLPDQWRTLYPLRHWAGSYIWIWMNRISFEITFKGSYAFEINNITPLYLSLYRSININLSSDCFEYIYIYIYIYIYVQDLIWNNCCIVICWFMQKYTYISWIHTDAMITDAVINDAMIKIDAWRKTQEDFFNKTYTSYFIARVRMVCSRFTCERELEIEHKL